MRPALMATATNSSRKFRAGDSASTKLVNKKLQGTPSSMAGMADNGSGSIQPAALKGIASKARIETSV